MRGIRLPRKGVYSRLMHGKARSVWALNKTRAAHTQCITPLLASRSLRAAPVRKNIPRTIFLTRTVRVNNKKATHHTMHSFYWRVVRDSPVCGRHRCGKTFPGLFFLTRTVRVNSKKATHHTMHSFYWRVVRDSPVCGRHRCGKTFPGLFFDTHRSSQ